MEEAGCNRGKRNLESFGLHHSYSKTTARGQQVCSYEIGGGTD